MLTPKNVGVKRLENLSKKILDRCQHEASGGSRQAVRSNLRIILEKDLVNRRSELALPLIDAFSFDKETRFSDRLRIAVLANQLDRVPIAHAILDSVGPHGLPRSDAHLRSMPAPAKHARTCEACPHLHGIGTEREVLDLLINFNPGIARRYLVLTRRPDVRHDDQEQRRFRRHALARIHRLLGRSQLARRVEADPATV